MERELTQWSKMPNKFERFDFHILLCSLNGVYREAVRQWSRSWAADNWEITSILHKKCVIGHGVIWSYFVSLPQKEKIYLLIKSTFLNIFFPWRTSHQLYLPFEHFLIWNMSFGKSLWLYFTILALLCFKNGKYLGCQRVTMVIINKLCLLCWVTYREGFFVCLFICSTWDWEALP